jgi:hypothetical protein
MPRPKQSGDDWEDDWNDEDADDPDDGDEDTIPCPYCRQPIHEDSVRCPHCENYISEEDTPARKPWWLILGVVVCLLIVYMWIRQGF